MNEPTKTVLLKPSDSVKEIHGEDGAMLLDVHQGRTFGLDPVGAKIWEMLRRGVQVNEIIQDIAALCNMPEDQVRSDIEEFIANMLRSKLLFSAKPNRTSRRFRGIRMLWHRLISMGNGS